MSTFVRTGRLVMGAWVGVTLATPLTAVSGLVGGEDERGAPRKSAAVGYVLRCWQEGRLIVEEHHVRLPAEAAGARLRLIDRNEQLIYIADTRNATCVIKARAPARTRADLP
ncbi:MAG: hypothetical protein N2688_02960 [Burkholderiaceae bacterium]|nr:hypothetical protein [Burkholderiaceae bacterium]